eukprot:CAMPEP_0118951904 /NCGR_PEP_ID=MMETSP1169-20130426/53911_1 /TAXON_ID=36882 /ORGANISM="Pyramimonas obovata, Strain CCMP722" /LENGTH=46 /DNA_ID= /DNA_START= /DNA_END= /DNA_ORIENTATION=
MPSVPSWYMFSAHEFTKLSSKMPAFTMGSSTVRGIQEGGGGTSTRT